MTTPATLTVDHVRALVATLHPDDLTPCARRVLLLACEYAEQAHAERLRRAAVTENHDCAPLRRMPDSVGFLGPLA